MKITKRQLRRIIKEEKRKCLLNESLQSAEEKFVNTLDVYVTALDEDMGYNVPNDQIEAEVLSQVEGHFEFLKDYEKNPQMYGGE